MDEDNRTHIQRATEATRNLRRLQQEMLALTQKITTSLDGYCLGEVEDWEDRYVREGFLEVEGYANGEASA